MRITVSSNNSYNTSEMMPICTFIKSEYIKEYLVIVHTMSIANNVSLKITDYLIINISDKPSITYSSEYDTTVLYKYFLYKNEDNTIDLRWIGSKATFDIIPVMDHPLHFLSKTYFEAIHTLKEFTHTDINIILPEFINNNAIYNGAAEIYQTSIIGMDLNILYLYIQEGDNIYDYKIIINSSLTTLSIIKPLNASKLPYIKAIKIDNTRYCLLFKIYYKFVLTNIFGQIINLKCNLSAQEGISPTYYNKYLELPHSVSTYGNFASKPTYSKLPIGFSYFCTDKQTSEGNSNGIMIYYKGDNVWVDALGRTVE